MGSFAANATGCDQPQRRMLMNREVIHCPGCDNLLQFAATALKMTVTCPECGESISFFSQTQGNDVVVVNAELAVDDEIIDSELSTRTRMSDGSIIGLVLLLIVLLVLLPTGIIVGGGYLVYKSLASAEPVQGLRTPSPTVRSLAGSADQQRGTPNPVLPPTKRSVDPQSGNPRPINVETPENPDLENLNPGNTESGQPVAMSGNSDELKYRWVKGDEHVYSLHIVAGESAEREDIRGLCTYNVSDNGFDYGDEVEASGTGFAIAADGYIATCAHVIREFKEDCSHTAA